VRLIPAFGYPRIRWPEGRRFAFTVFDDTDLATRDNVAEVYRLLADLGMRTTKSVWVREGAAGDGSSCAEPAYLEWVRDLQRQGFEIGFHNASSVSSTREQTRAALERFEQLFGHMPRSMSNHSRNAEGIYWGEARLEQPSRTLFNLATRGLRRGQFRGHEPGDEGFWGDLCRQHVRYVRNFVFDDVNTLRCCPFMPYHDARKPYVSYWYASSEGATVESFTKMLAPGAQERLEAEGGACIMYTHFASGFQRDERLDPRFRSLMERLARRPGWFVPTSELLDHLHAQLGHHEISVAERTLLELRWLAGKAFLGHT
jgi:hypothetical protein